MKPDHQQSYGVIFSNISKDRHQHNHTFCAEISAGFKQHGIDIIELDYISDSRQVTSALQDPNCLFFLCFNGFGSELLVHFAPGDLRSAFDHYRKPLFDFMHDCPIHESMAHQIKSTGRYRTLLITDYSYAQISRLLGVHRVYAVSSITFPNTAPTVRKASADREIDVLLPVGLSSAQWTKERFLDARNYKQRVYREIFESVSENTVDDLEADPLMEMFRTFQELQIPINFQDPDVRFLFTAVLDFVKFSRRDKLISAIQHLPVTVISDVRPENPREMNRLKFLGSRSFPSLIETMGNSKAVICPLPHYNGFHERSLAAFTAGAAVIAAPNEILESQFTQGKDMLTYRNLEELANILEDVFAKKLDLETISAQGREKAMTHFPPTRISDFVMSALSSSRTTPSASTL
ncbi:glycosyltransferase [Cupriavidus alkaliphilus]|uniref:glycosyltransferase n=1 Tax=Cupriavidus alkaliphilus TaxID=942866 RepID=UPI00339D7857